MQVTVISPEQAVFEGTADGVVVPAYDGELGILPRHAPLMTLLGVGDLKVRQTGTTHTFQVKGGFLQVANDVVRVVAEYAQARG
jgi:F-type H+-transporting ATPase subunit epsilon